MLRITCYSLLASGLITSAAWTVREHLSPGASSAGSGPALANDLDFQELMAWVEIVEDRNSLDVRDWLAAQEYRSLPGPTPRILIDQLEPGMDRVAVRALFGDPHRVDNELDAWVYDTISIFFADGGVQGWIETDRHAAQRLALRNAMMPLGKTDDTDSIDTSARPRVHVATPSASGSGFGRGNNGGRRGYRSSRQRMMDRARRPAGRRSTRFRKSAFLRSMFSSPGGSSRYGNRRNGTGYSNYR